MDIAIRPHSLRGEIDAPLSKSYLHRLLIASFISGRRVFVECGELSKDIAATVGALKAMGAEITSENGGIFIERKFIPSDEITIDCNESGSTLRFLIPLAAALGIKARFTGSGRLLERPVFPLTEVLNAHGSKAEGFSVSGKLECGDYRIDGSLSSQFVTGLLFALAALGGKSTLEIVGKKVSEGYINITIEVLRLFGAEIIIDGRKITVSGRLNGKIERVKAEGDWSNSAFFLAAGAINGDVTVNGLNPESGQGDRKFLDILKDFGAEIQSRGNIIKVSKGRLKAIRADIDEIPDLAQIISVVAAFSEGVTVLDNVGRLRLKESDRVNAIIKMLETSGIKAECSDNKIFIYGGSPSGGIFDGGNDHRTVMSSAVLAACAQGNSEIKGAQACEKSYPDFFKQLIILGGKADVVL